MPRCSRRNFPQVVVVANAQFAERRRRKKATRRGRIGGCPAVRYWLDLSTSFMPFFIFAILSCVVSLFHLFALRSGPGKDYQCTMIAVLLIIVSGT